MSRMPFITSALLLLALSLVGCVTPQPALNEANNGAALTVSLASEIKNFDRTQAKISQARLDSVRRLRVRLANYEADGNFDERVLKAADKTDTLKLFTALKDLSDSRALDDRQLQDKVAAIDATFIKLLDPLPDALKDLAATQKALAVLGDELPIRERVANTAAFVKEIRKSVEENRDKIRNVETKGTAAPVQPDKPTDHP